MLATFVPDLPVLAAFVAASIVLGITPGPDMTFFLSKTIAQSRLAGFAALGGVSVGVTVHSVLVAAGLSVLLAASATAFTVLKVAGAALSRLARHRRHPPRLVAVARCPAGGASRCARSSSRGC